MRSIEDIEKQVKNTIADREREFAEIKQAIADQEQFKLDAKKDKTAATEAGDLDAFRILEQQIRDADAAIEFYNARLACLESRKDVFGDVTRQIDADLIACQNKANADFEKEALPVIDELRSIVNKYKSINSRIFAAFDNWHGNVSKTLPPNELPRTWLYMRIEKDMRLFDQARKYTHN